MRLLNVHSLKFQTFNNYVPKYAVASHRWSDDEIHFEDVKNLSTSDHRIGAKKLRGFCNAIKYLRVEGLDWLWMDTTCIKQDSDREVNEAVNSMFRWYQQAYICLAYLSDRTYRNLTTSVWFTRGWTLQELIAPKLVVFYDQDWRLAGHKGIVPHGMDLGVDRSALVREATGIPAQVLNDSDAMSQMSAQEKWDWMGYRITTKQEDRAYCMLGLFGVTLSPIYGEGGERAIDRLRSEVLRVTGESFEDECVSVRTNPSSCWRLLYIRTAQPSSRFVVVVPRTFEGPTIWDVKVKIEELESYFPQKLQRLFYVAAELKLSLEATDHSLLEDIGIKDGDTLWLEMKVPENAKQAGTEVNQSQPVTSTTGRKRGRRRVMKKVTDKDDEGFLVTREEPVWESFSEDEPSPKKIRVTPQKARVPPKKGQGSIRSFFGP